MDRVSSSIEKAPGRADRDRADSNLLPERSSAFAPRLAVSEPAALLPPLRKNNLLPYEERRSAIAVR